MTVGSVNSDGTAEPPIDFTFRPATYWPNQESLEVLVSRIKGEQRRLRGEVLLHEGRIEELWALIDEGALSGDLTDEDREAWGRLHPSNLGGEYLPGLEDEEVEIARVAIASTTGDVQSIRAHRVSGEIAVQVVDEYGDDFATGTRIYSAPLTLLGADRLHRRVGHRRRWNARGSGPRARPQVVRLRPGSTRTPLGRRVGIVSVLPGTCAALRGRCQLTR